MLNGMGANIKTNEKGQIEIEPLTKPLEPLNITVPADPSSGFFFAVRLLLCLEVKWLLKM